MRIAFVTPTLHSLGPNWRRDPQIVKLAAPTLAGALYSQGYSDLRQYDFEIQLFAIEERTPGRLRLRTFFDDAAVDAYLCGGASPEVEDQVELILDALAVEEADLVAFSCASTIGVYADIHAAANICLALATGVRRRFPACKSVIGGMQISPDSLQREEYLSCLRRCAALDFSVEGNGEYPLLRILWHLEGRESLEGADGVEDTGHGFHQLRAQMPPGRLPKEFKVAAAVPGHHPTPELEKPEGDHERKALSNPSIRFTPWFDAKNIDLRKLSGAELLDRYHLGDEWRARLAPRLDDRVAILPYIFLEGCNARCAFCTYSTTSLQKQDIDQVIRSLHWMVDTYGVRYFHFLNTNINGSLKYADAFCDAIIQSGLDIRWSDCANLWALNERLMDKLRESGCIRLTFGLECPSPRMLKYILKGVDVETAHARLQYLDQLGIWNHLLLITGLPTETPEDSKHFVEFLRRSSPYVHGYSISSFYLIENSLMGQNPERFGLRLRRNASGLLEDAAFDEIDGLSWEEKRVQIIESTELIQKTINALKADPKYTSGSIDLELLFWLYDALGHDAKPDIVRAYEEGFLDTPNHARYLAAPLRELVGQPSDAVRGGLARLHASARAEAIRIDGRDVIVPLEARPAPVELRFSLGEPASDRGAKPLAAGHQVRVAPVTLVNRAARLLAPTSPLIRFLASNGWTPVAPDGTHAPDVARVTDGAATIDVTLHPAGPNDRCFVRGDRHGMSFRVVSGALTDPGRTHKLLTLFGEKAVAILDEQTSTDLDPAALEAVAGALVAELEAPYLALWETDPTFAGMRHGDRYSRVAPAEGVT